MTQSERVIKYLQQRHRSVSSEELTKNLEISKSRLYSTIHNINKKCDGFAIKNVNKKYILKAIEIRNRPVKYQQKNLQTHSIQIPSEFLKKVTLMSEPDRSDALEMLKKSFFYKKSAEALVEANEVIEQLRLTFE